MRHACVALALLAAVGLAPATWAEPGRACPFDEQMRAAPAPRRTLLLEGPVFVSADQLKALDGGVSEFSGHVDLRRGEGRLAADELRYDRHSNQADASGNVQLSNTFGDLYATQELHLNLATRIGSAGPGTFALTQPHARGDAERLQFEGPDRTRLVGVRFTTCAPGQESWFLHSRELLLDTAEDLGTAYHAWVEFQGVPIFYFPYINFPISDRRKSGFLIPRVGYSDKSGFELATPYYFNLAPNYDDTLTPRLLTDRGLQLQNEFRHLGRGATTRFDLQYLPSDRIYGDDRAAGVLQHTSQWSGAWTGRLDLNWVSDKNYLGDFGEDLNVTAQTHLPQVAETNYRGPGWRFMARAADYQTVDPTIAASDRPYARLPQLWLATTDRTIPNRPQLQVDGEWVNFERPDSVTGGRLNAGAGVALPLRNSYAFVTPRASARAIQYALNNSPDASDPAVAVGVFSLDSGLFFERDTRWGARSYVQTLEPRLFYLYVPYRDQDAQPNFDTTVPDFSFLNLFRDNRFVGGDRIGDANQLSIALTTRLLDEHDGVERLRASVGEIVYFADRRVGLPASGSAPGPAAIGVGDSANSSLVGELAARLVGNWYAQATILLNEQNYDVDRHGVYLQYQPAPNRILVLGERYTRAQLKQTELAAHWPLGSHWTVLGRSLYSQFDHRNVDSYLGVEYNACCWALRAFAGKRYSPDDDRQISSIQLQLQLAGLSKLGKIPDSPLQQGLFYAPGMHEPAGSAPP